MSSRALRKLQKEHEQARQLALLRAEEAGDEEYEQDVEPESEQATLKATPKAKSNAFDLLNGTDAGKDDSEDEVGNDAAMFKPENVSENARLEAQTATPESARAKKKKKKSKKKNKAKLTDEGTTPTTATGTGDEAEMDEIDRALMVLSTKDGKSALSEEVAPSRAEDESALWETKATKLLAIDSKNLNPVNEMRSLFGNIALEGSSDTRPSPRNLRRREQNQEGGVDLATALTGRYSQASKGKDLGALASRRNVFMQGHEEWPRATSGGLSMEFLESNSFERRYSITHNNTYREIQYQFRLCVESMQAENMIQLLRLNPYHIATLLQVSEIAKHQGDHSVSGDLLERALFSFGRSVHSTFPAALRDGTARISFEKPENRELYLSIWRYIQSLGQRGTWRTAFEWAKVLFQFNTLSDPYGITLMIDQLALRGRQHTAFIELCSDESYGSSWRHLPNIQISLALAHQRSASPKLARQALAIAMTHYPYIISALASSLDISPLPKSLWGKLPSTDAEKLYTELYVTRTKDLWNTPETTSLIVEVAETLEMYSSLLKSTPTAPKLEISLEEARHIMLLDIPSLIALLPRRFTNMSTSSSDVLPPPSSHADDIGFVARAPTGQPGGGLQALMNATGNAGAAAAMNGAGLLTRVLNWFQSPAGPNDRGEEGEEGESEGAAAVFDLNEQLGGAPPEVLQEILRLHFEAEIDRDGRTVPGQWTPPETSPTGSDIEDDHINARDGTNSESPEADSRGAGAEIGRLSPAEDGFSVPMNSQSNSARPYAAAVEDEEEDEGVSRRELDGPLRASGGAVLRHIDSDSEEESVPVPVPSSHTANPAQASGVDTSDPQRVQRWLLSTGLQTLQTDSSTVRDYVRKLNSLRPRDRDWTVNIIKQRAGTGVAELVKREMGR